MAKSINKLDPLTVGALNDKGRYADGDGLYLQVGPTGKKSWLFRYSLDRSARQMGLGALGALSLKEAREQARECRKLLLDGIDPLEHRKVALRALKTERENNKTFKWCAEQYIADQGEGWKNAKHRQQWHNTLITYAFPQVGNIPVNEIETNHVIKILKPIWFTKTETASRLRGRIERVLGWAKHKNYREGSNPAVWKDNLQYELPPKSQIQNVKHHAALKYDEIGNFMKELRLQTSISSSALEFLILTAARTGEVIEAHRDEIDIKKRLWTIPAKRMKMKVEHNVPLSDAALAVITALPVIDGSPFLFPGQRKGRPLSNMALLKLLDRMGHNNITAHGFRSSFRDWAAENTAFPRNIPELCLAHGPKDKVEAAYLRTKLMPKRRDLLNAWATYCSILSNDRNNIVLINKRQR